MRTFTIVVVVVGILALAGLGAWLLRARARHETETDRAAARSAAVAAAWKEIEAAAATSRAVQGVVLSGEGHRREALVTLSQSVPPTARYQTYTARATLHVDLTRYEDGWHAGKAEILPETEVVDAAGVPPDLGGELGRDDVVPFPRPDTPVSEVPHPAAP